MNIPEKQLKLKDPRCLKFKEKFCGAIYSKKYMAVTAPRGFCLNRLLGNLVDELHNDGQTIVYLDGRRLQTYSRSLCLQIALELLDNLSVKDVQQKDRYQAIKLGLVKGPGTASPAVLKKTIEEIFKILPEGHPPLILVLSNIHLFKEGAFEKEIPYTLDGMIRTFRSWHEDQIFPTSALLICLAGFLEVKKQTSHTSPFNIAEEINIEPFSRDQVGILCSQLEGLKDPESSAEEVFSLTAGHPLHTFAILQYLKREFPLEEAEKYIMWEDPSGHLRHILNLFSVSENLLKLSYYIYKKDTERLKEIQPEVLEEAYYEGFLKDPLKEHTFYNELIASYVAKIFSSPNNLLGFLNVRDRKLLSEMLDDIAKNETRGQNNLFSKYLNTHALQVQAKQWMAEWCSADAYLKRALEEIESIFDIKSIFYHYSTDNRNLCENGSGRQISSAEWRKSATSILCCSHICFFHKHTLLDCDNCPLIFQKAMLSLCRKNGYACFPIRMGLNEGARFVYGTVLLFHQEIENLYPLLIPFFRDVNDTLERLYYRYLLVETVDFTGRGPWVNKEDFLEDLGVFLQEMFQSSRVYLFLSDPTRQRHKLAYQYPKEERRQDILEGELAFVMWVASRGEVLNFTHPNDFAGLPWLDLSDEKGGWAALAFPLKGKHGFSARGVAVVVSATPSPDNCYFFTSFHKIVAKLIGKYAGSVLDQLEDRENMVLTIQQAVHRQTKIVYRIRQGVKDEFPERSTEIDKLLENFTASLRLHMGSLMLDKLLKKGLISEVVKSYRGKYYDFPCRFDPTGERKVWLSSEFVKYILENLVSNHEKVKISKSLPPQSRFKLSFYEKRKYLVLRYEDELGGLSDEIKSKFPELQASETGLGMGFYHCHLLMEKMGGRMGIDNLPDNRGAVFEFYFRQAQ